MKGWFSLALLLITIYYLGVHTHLLDKPINYSRNYLASFFGKLDRLSNPKPIRGERQTHPLRVQLRHRMNKVERQELAQITSSVMALEYFISQYCTLPYVKHPTFARDNQQILCDQLAI